MPQEVVDKIEKFAEERGITRSKAIIDAVLFYSSGVECVKCGTVNNEEGHLCSCCGAELFTDDIIEKTIIIMTEKIWVHGVIDIDEDYLELVNYMEDSVKNMLNSTFSLATELGLSPSVNAKIERNRENTKYYAVVYLTTKDGTTLAPLNKENKIEYPRSFVYKFAKKIFGVLKGDATKIILDSVDDVPKDTATE